MQTAQLRHLAERVEGRPSSDGIDRPYMDLFRWIALAGAAYLPATVVPAGMSADGLPIGVQIVGPYLHDRTTLQLARHLETMAAVPHPSLAI